MTTDPGEINYLRIMIEKKRKKNSFWKWPDRQVEERCLATEILSSAGVDVVGVGSREQGEDPPDCEATLDGRVSGIEVTELIDQETLEWNLHQPESPAYFDWDQTTFLAALQKCIDDKDRVWKGGPYERRFVVIHTDEHILDREIVGRFLDKAQFRATLVTDVVLGLSYHGSAEPGGGCCPAFRLNLSQS